MRWWRNLKFNYDLCRLRKHSHVTAWGKAILLGLGYRVYYDPAWRRREMREERRRNHLESIYRHGP